jgi:CDP-2,3-bis-(O-geranylgeranyl)-sn-glycerol synthase
MQCFYFLLPGALATLAPQLVAHFHWWEALKKPIDGGRTIEGKRIFGNNKTIRGYVVGIGAALGSGIVQYFLYNWNITEKIGLFDYSQIENTIVISFLLGSGALIGDSVKSFFKRQLQIAPGKSWVVFDQIDFILGALIFSLPVIQLQARHYVGIVIVYFCVHVITTLCGFFLGVKKNWI